MCIPEAPGEPRRATRKFPGADPPGIHVVELPHRSPSGLSQHISSNVDHG